MYSHSIGSKGDIIIPNRKGYCKAAGKLLQRQDGRTKSGSNARTRAERSDIRFNDTQHILD